MDRGTTVGNRVLIGTSGYSYEDWVGPFYPQGLSKGDYLGFYAGEFPVVELNFSYYTQPSASALKRMLEKTPEDFRFCIKAHRSLTHDIGEDLPREIERYKQGIQPLVDAIHEIFDAGFGGQLCLGLDCAFSSESGPFKYCIIPPPPFLYMFTHTLPAFRELGLTGEEEDALMRANPQRILPVQK